MLRLVHPSSEGKVSAHSPYRRILSVEESNRVRATIRNLHYAHGGWDVLAAMTGYSKSTIQDASYHRDKPVSLGIAIQIARIAGVPVEHILSGKPREAGICPTCGSRKRAR